MTDYLIKFGFHGRKNSGRASWSLSKPQSIKFFLNKCWDDTVLCAEKAGLEYPDIPPARYVRIVQSIFSLVFSEIVAHEVLHLILHEEPEVRRAARFAGGRYNEGEFHHRAILPLLDGI